MILFCSLIIILFLTIIFFVSYPYFKYKVIESDFKKLVSKKIDKLVNKNKYLVIHNLKVKDFRLNYVKIDHILFANNYIYLIQDYPFIGELNGINSDNSWIHYSAIKKNKQIINNLNNIGKKNIEDLLGISSVNPDNIKTIAVIPNECMIKIDEINTNQNYVISYSKLFKIIEIFEEEDISKLDSISKKREYNLLRNKNEEERTNKYN